RGVLPLDGIVPLAPSLDHLGPMARSVADCALVLGAMTGAPGAGPVAPPSLAGLRLARSPRVATVEVDPDVADGYERAIAACEGLGAMVVELASPAPLDVTADFFSVFAADMLPFHRRLASGRDRYRQSVRGLVEGAERAGLSAEDYVAMQVRRDEVTWSWREWFAGQRIDAVLEPTVPVVAPPRGDGYWRVGTDTALISLTYYWNWTGFPVVALPAGVGTRSGLPVSVSLIGTTGSDSALAGLGMRLEAELPIPVASGLGC
ncbi:MAG: amidase family protein, partial [Acidimicrobiales bacterium]